MNDELKTVQSLDLTGLACPMPVVKVSKAMKDINSGDVIDALTSDPGALTDFPAWAKTTGNEILKTGRVGRTQHGNSLQDGWQFQAPVEHQQAFPLQTLQSRSLLQFQFAQRKSRVTVFHD